ncbi:MAG: hypothetical protein ACJ8R9_20695 [Steroidobacteraceae bacterium]
MTTDADAINVAGAREVYGLLDQLDRHINGQDASGRALLYQLKERVRLLIVSIDRANAE